MRASASCLSVFGKQGAPEQRARRYLADTARITLYSTRTPFSENEVVVLRGQIQTEKVRDSLASLSARSKPWPVALVLAYSTQGALNTTQAVGRLLVVRTSHARWRDEMPRHARLQASAAAYS